MDFSEEEDREPAGRRLGYTLYGLMRFTVDGLLIVALVKFIFEGIH